MSKFFILFFSIASFFLYAENVHSAEVDSFTNRYEIFDGLRDDTEKINSKINHYINLGIKKANYRSKKCKEKHVQKFVRRYLGGHFRIITNGLGRMGENNLYRWLKYDGPISRHFIKVPNSVYRDFKGIKAPSLKIVSLFHDTMGSMHKINGLVIGSDKFSHFFNRGLKYYKNYTGKSRKTRKLKTQAERTRRTLKLGTYSEASIWGSKSTGVASYGDLAANFQGLRFWNDMFGTTADPVTGLEVEEPYLSCVNGVWRQNSYVDIRKYFNTAFDEAYNCSKFQTRKMANQVKTRVTNLEDGRYDYHCPLNLDKLRETKNDFGKFYDHVVNETPYLAI